MTLDTRTQSSHGVAIIIAAYNAENTITRAIRSALAEPEVAEAIVVDDASTDGTIKRALEADDGSGRLRMLAQTENAGPSAARNRAIRESASPWIGILDADDYLLPDRMRGLLAYADEADLVADDLWQVTEGDPDGPRRSLLGEALMNPRPVSFREFVMGNVTRKGRAGGELGFIKPVMRRSFLDRHDIRYLEHMRLGEDYELYARALAKGARLLLAPAQGYISVMRKNSLSALHSETDLLHLRDCNDALMGIPSLSQEDRDALRSHYLSIDCRLQWRLLIKAAKQRDAVAALRTFMRPYPVPLYNMQKLVEQAFVRTFRRLN
jgi:succinoglycan biosynthesis protein ExoU